MSSLGGFAIISLCQLLSEEHFHSCYLLDNLFIFLVLVLLFLIAKGFRKTALFVRVVVTLPAQDVCSYHKIFWARLKQYQHLFTGFKMS